jgi:hypothetical protein
MPESVNSEGGKASKGEYGFRYGASVPRPMLMAFSKVRPHRMRVHELDLLLLTRVPASRSRCSRAAR